MSECTNPSRPCHLHDPSNSWLLETRRSTIHGGWYIAALVFVIILASFVDGGT